MKRMYDLNGFKIVILGFILSAVFSAAEFIFPDGWTYGIALLLELAAGIVTIVGISKLCINGIRFVRARNSGIAAMALTAVSVLLLLFASGGWTQWGPDGSGPDLEDHLALTGISMFLLIAAGVAILVCSYNLLYGCKDIAEQQWNPEFGKKCKTAWIVFICGTILPSAIIEGWTDAGEDSVLLTIAAAAVDLIILIWVLRIFYCTYRLYNGLEIKELEDEGKRLPEDPRGPEQ